MSHFTSYDIVDWDKPFEKSQKPLESPHGFEVLICVTAAGLCHSDLHIKKGFMDLGEQGELLFSDRGLKLPRTLGHEIAGVVEDVGEDVTTVEVGQQVLVFPWVGCGDCPACQEQRESDCSAMRIIGLLQPGGFASHCLVEHEKFLVDIEGLDASMVVPHACSGITVYNALTKVGSLREDEWLAIFGVGGLGLNAVAIASALGHENIIAVDINETKLEAAREMGASRLIKMDHKEDLLELKHLANGRLMSIVDTFGGEDTAELAVHRRRADT